MNRRTIALIVIALLVVLLVGSIFSFKSPGLTPSDVKLTLPNFSLPLLDLNLDTEAVKKDAWSTFQQYLSFAKNHELDGLRTVTYKLSSTCENPETRTDCFALMDNLYEKASSLTYQDFKFVETDGRQVVLHTNGPVVGILYFIHDEDNTLKLLGISFCLQVEVDHKVLPCVDQSELRKDENKNGWWDVIETQLRK